MTKKEKFKKFVKDHKVEIAAGLGLAAASIAIGCSINKKSVKAVEIMDKLTNDTPNYCNGWVELANEQVGIGTVTDLSFNTVDGYVDAIVNDITVADIGKLGEGLMNVSGITQDNEVSMMISVLGVGKTE